MSGVVDFKNRDRFIQLGIAHPFSLEVFFNIADALDIDPADLINASVFPDKVLGNNKS